MQLIIATPSPFARKVRIALREKGIAHDEIVDNPWTPEARVRALNPLGKVPTLVLDDGRTITDSKVIIGHLETLGRPPQLLPMVPEQRVAHRQVEAIADGICDAVVLIVLERARPAERQSPEWIERQRAKVVHGVADLAQRLGARDTFTSHGLGLAEIATGCALGYLGLRFPEFEWRAGHPHLARLFDALSKRPSFAQTVPVAQNLSDIR